MAKSHGTRPRRSREITPKPVMLPAKPKFSRHELKEEEHKRRPELRPGPYRPIKTLGKATRMRRRRR